jgi:hypothetical protein
MGLIATLGGAKATAPSAKAATAEATPSEAASPKAATPKAAASHNGSPSAMAAASAPAPAGLAGCHGADYREYHGARHERQLQ